MPLCFFLWWAITKIDEDQNFDFHETFVFFQVGLVLFNNFFLIIMIICEHS